MVRIYAAAHATSHGLSHAGFHADSQALAQSLAEYCIVTHCCHVKEGTDPAEDHDMLQSSLIMLQLCQIMLWRHACSNGVLSDSNTALVHDCVCLHKFTNSRTHKQMNPTHVGKTCIMGTNCAQSCNQ